MNLRCFLPCLVLALAAPWNLAADRWPEAVVFLEQHCFHCHGPDEQKGRLRLDTLTAPPAEDDTWLAVLEAIETGDMPPRAEPRPDPAAADYFVGLVSAVLAEAAGPPPIALRRMNRVEYEATVHDLLGIDTPLADLLPEDSRTQGFDNVADGLGISAVLLEKYLEAADAAFEGVIRRIEPLPAETRRAEIMQVSDNQQSVEQNRGGVIEVANSMVKFTPGWPLVRINPAHPIEDGVYRGRVAVWPHDPSDRTLVVAIFTGPLYGPGQRHFQGMFDATGTPEDPRIIEFTASMRAEESIHIIPWVFPEHITWRHGDMEPRPGVGVVWAETHGPIDQDFPSKAQLALFGDSDTIHMAEGNPVWMRYRRGVRSHYVDSTEPEADAERIIRDLVARAFRRPVPDDMADPFVQLTLGRLENGHTFEQAVRSGFTAVLCSPHFLLLNQDPEVDDYTIASRMSYFLWSSMPDEELLELAAAGRLSDPAVRSQQVDRMLEDERSERFVSHFTGQWLDLREIDFTTPDGRLYPEFDELLQRSMVEETVRFFRHVLDHDLGVKNFINSDFTILNERLARHYDIPGVTGHEEFRVVDIPPDNVRGGLLTHGSILKVTANGATTSPVLRGVWVLDRLLGIPVPPPPSGVPAVEPDIRGAESVREQFTQHTRIESCARCHDRIDPPGFALEQFDPIGGERDYYRSVGEGERVPLTNYHVGLPVEPHGEVWDGHRFDDFPGFRDWLAGQHEQVARAVAHKLLVYGTGRSVGVMDRDAVDALVDAVRGDDFGLRSMVRATVENELFHRP